jgi:hypothetical protein
MTTNKPLNLSLKQTRRHWSWGSHQAPDHIQFMHATFIMQKPSLRVERRAAAAETLKK